MKLPLEAIAFYSDSFVARKINVEQKVAENWDWPRTGPHTVLKISKDGLSLNQSLFDQNILNKTGQSLL